MHLDEPERKVDQREECTHQQGKTPGSGMRKRIYKTVKDIGQQTKRMGRKVPTVPSKKASEIDTKTGRKQKHNHHQVYLGTAELLSRYFLEFHQAQKTE